MSPLQVSLRRLPHAHDLPLPCYQTEHAAGVDVHAAIEISLTIQPGERASIPTGLQLAVPEVYEAQVRPRSGLALRYGISLVNAPGTIDADYRGEVTILLINHGQEPVTINRGDRVAQIIFNKVERADIIEVDELNATGRGRGGFGSTGR